MARIIQNLEVGLNENLDEVIREKLALQMTQFTDYRILRQSVDARRRHAPHFVMTVEVAEAGEKLENPTYPIPVQKYQGKEKPIIIGSGPAGLFAALRFVERGIPCHLFERGSQAEERIKGINRFWRYGTLDPRNNVCYGEGGAGLYSDGKLITRIKSPHIPYVLQRLVQFGAPEEIQYLANPHVGSDKIRRLIPHLRKFLISQGCEIHYNTKVEKILTNGPSVIGIETEYQTKFHSEHIILATGHSAEDMLMHLHDIGVHLDGKSFAMGLRIEHSQKEINQIQYRDFADHPKLKSANYKLVHHNQKTNIGVYSFCMCPGGYVLSSGTEADGIVCNGMSNFNRNSPYANSAIVMSLDHEKLFGQDLFGGLKLRRQLEREAYDRVLKAGGTKELPAQKLSDFLSRKTGSLLPTSSPSGAKSVALHEILPDFMLQNIIQGLEKFNTSMKGFISEKAQLYGVESRTSCPLRVTRNPDTLESISHQGLYPCGEGAGYAGGITSAACDGVRIADKISEILLQNQFTPLEY